MGGVACQSLPKWQALQHSLMNWFVTTEEWLRHISIGLGYGVVHNVYSELHYQKVCGSWVLRMLVDDLKTCYMMPSLSSVQQYMKEGNGMADCSHCWDYCATMRHLQEAIHTSWARLVSKTFVFLQVSAGTAHSATGCSLVAAVWMGVSWMSAIWP